jgi:hypothetical protein
MSAFLGRVLRAAGLDSGVYREVGADRGATSQALVVVLVAGLATGLRLGALEGAATAREVPAQIVLAFAGWVVATSVAYLVCKLALRQSEPQTSWGLLGRALGFAHTPVVLRVLGLVPGVATLVAFVVLVWQLVAILVAIHAATVSRSYWRTVVVTAPVLAAELVTVVGLSRLVR